MEQQDMGVVEPVTLATHKQNPLRQQPQKTLLSLFFDTDTSFTSFTSPLAPHCNL